MYMFVFRRFVLTANTCLSYISEFHDRNQDALHVNIIYGR